MNEVPFSLQSRPGIVLSGHALDGGSGPVGLFVHGFRSDSRGEKAQALTNHARRLGYSWARFDLGAHGQSTGLFEEQTLSGWREDVLCVARRYPHRPLILVGSSLGAWLAVLVARMASLPVTGLVLLAPAFNFLQRHYEGLPAALQSQWQANGYLPVPDLHGAPGATYRLGHRLVDDASQHDVLSAPVALSCPLVIFHGTEDALVPLSVSEDFMSRLQAPEKRLIVVPGGDHRLTAALPEILAAVDGLWAAAVPRSVGAM